MDNKIQKLNTLETHDRLKFFTRQNFDISITCQNIIDSDPFDGNPFYIFAHKRSIELDEKYDLWASGQFANLADLPSGRIIWQPRLTRPRPQENSMLFKAYPRTDLVKVIWMIPDRSLWDCYEKGKLTENEMIATSIYDFQHNREKLAMKEEDDLPDDVIDRIYEQISRKGKEDRYERQNRRPRENPRDTETSV
jgi:hypothetical protein